MTRRHHHVRHHRHHACNDDSTDPGPAPAERSSATPGGALKVQLRAADFSAGEALLAPRETVQKTPVQRSEAAPAAADEPAEGEPGVCSMTDDLGDMSSYAEVLQALGGGLDVLAPAVGSGVNLAANASVTASGAYAKIAFGAHSRARPPASAVRSP